MNKQSTMRTRNTRKSGQTPPPKKGSKTPVKGDSPAQPSAAIEAAVANTEEEVVETKPTLESAEVEAEAKIETNIEKGSVESSLEVNGDDKKADFSYAASTEKPGEAEARPAKLLSPASAKKQKRATPSKKAAADAGEGAVQVENKENKETVSTQSELVKAIVGDEASNDKKDSDIVSSTEVTVCKVTFSSSETIEINDDDAGEAKAETEPAAELEAEDAAGDVEMEEAAQEDGDEEVAEEGEEEEEEAEGEEEVEGEGVDNEEFIENEAEEEEENEEEDEGGEEEVEGEELEGGDIAEEHLELQEPRPVTERQKRKKLEVFIGGLDKEATEDDVKKAFENVGEVVEVRLTRNPHTGKNKGYAFVRFATAEQATRAATELKRTQIKGKSCGIVPSEDNDVLFIGNINKSWKTQQVEEKLKEYGIDGIEELTLMDDPQNEGMNRGFVFVELVTHNDAIMAFKSLAKPNIFFGSDRSAKVAWAQQNEPDEAVMSQVKSVFVDGILSSWTEEKVKELFGKYGEIERIVLARNMPRSKRNDFAFVNYAIRDAAIACIDALTDNDLVDGENKIKVKVKLAKPQLKGRVGKGGGIRGGYPLDRSVRPGRGIGGVPRGRIDSRRPVRGGRGFVRGGSRPFGRGRRAFEVAPAPKLPKVLPRQRELEHRPLPMERSRDRRPLGKPLRPSRVPLRDEFSRREEDIHRGRAGYSARPSHEYRGRREDIREDYPPPLPPRGSGFSESLPSRRGRSVRHPLPPPRDDGYLRRAERGYDYGRDASGGFSRARDYGEPGPGMKRPYSSLEEDVYYESRPRGYARARIDYDVPSPQPQYESVRAPPGRGVGAGRAPAPPIPVSQPSLGVYDQPGALGGSGGGAGSLYGSGSHGYGSAVSGGGDYMSSSAEIRGSSLYGNRSTSGGYGYPGAGSGSYY